MDLWGFSGCGMWRWVVNADCRVVYRREFPFYSTGGVFCWEFIYFVVWKLN
jgi:hypothetical protein